MYEVEAQEKPNRGLKILFWGIFGGTFGIAAATICSFLACFGLIVFGVFGAIRSSDFYEQALETAQNDPDVIAALGEPIEAGWWVMGTISTSGLSGEGDLIIPISGPDGSGTLYATGRRDTGEWTYFTLAVEVDGREELIDLMR